MAGKTSFMVGVTRNPSMLVRMVGRPSGHFVVETFTATSSEWSTLWWINIMLFIFKLGFSALLVPLIPFPWPDATDFMSLNTPAPERSIKVTLCLTS